MAQMHLLRVFCNDGGGGGNPLAVFLEGSEVAPGARQGVAAELGLSETVFVDDPSRGDLRIFTPTTELDFAGHPTVGTAFLLREERAPVETLRPPAGELPVRYEGELSFVSARPGWGPQYEFEQLGSPKDVERLDGPPPGRDMPAVWAWLDESAGVVRSRVFPLGIGVAEDEATGSAAMGLCMRLERPLDIRQGRGSRILARPLGDRIEIGGRSVLEEVKDFRSP
jgi:predicted PhzF superfamily epimerase YddE/YHI9